MQVKRYSYEEAERESLPYLTRVKKLKNDFPFLAKRLDAPVVRLQDGERKDFYILDGKESDKFLIGLHYVRINNIYIKSFCSHEKCYLCELHKTDPENVIAVRPHAIFTVVPVEKEKRTKEILILKFDNSLQDVYREVKDTKDFLKGTQITVGRDGKTTRAIAVRKTPEGQILRVRFREGTDTPFPYHEIYAPFTAAELRELGFNVSQKAEEKEIYVDEIFTPQTPSINDDEIDILIKEANEEDIVVL